MALAIEQPAWSARRVSEALKRRDLLMRCVWQRHNLTSMKYHLKTLEAKVAESLPRRKPGTASC